MFRAVLAVHIAAGFVGLVLGPVAMTARKREGAHTRAGEAYHWVMLVVCVTAALLAALEWSRLRASPWPWIVPTLVGTPIITWVNVRVRRGRAPRR